MECLGKYSVKNRVKIYWIIWAIATILLFVIRLLWNLVTDKQLTGLFIGYFILVCIPLNITIFLKQINLINYLKTHHKKKWEERFGTELSIFVLSRSKKKQVYFSKEDFGDPILRLIRKDYRSFFIFTNVVIISTFIIDIIMMLVFPVK